MCLDKARFAQTFVKGSYDVCRFAGRSATEKPDHRCRRLLGARRDRPLTSAPPSSVNASSHSISSSAVVIRSARQQLQAVSAELRG
jgi:hypothetical protein